MKIVTDKSSLTIPCTEVKDKELANSIIQHLKDTAKELNKMEGHNCVGLAANQLGYDKRVFIIKKGNRYKAFINPVLIAGKGKDVHPENCFSLPGEETVKVTRYKSVIVKADNQTKLQLKNMEAFAFQHELDHLNGVLI